MRRILPTPAEDLPNGPDATARLTVATSKVPLLMNRVPLKVLAPARISLPVLIPL